MKNQHKTKEMIIAEKEEKALATKRMAFINDVFMPTMEGMTENVEEAQMIVESIKVAINQAFLNKSKEMTIKDLKLEESLKKVKKPELVYKHVKVLEILSEQTVDDGIRLCNGLFEAANQAVVDQLKNRKLSDFRKNELPTSKEA